MSPMKRFEFAILSCTMAFLLLFNFTATAQQKLRERGAVVYELPKMDNVIIKKDIPYQDTDGPNLKMDVYYPPDFDFQRIIPAIIVVLGYPDSSGKKLVGDKFKNYIQFVSWCKIISTSGMIAVAYESDNPEKDIITLSEHLITNADKLNIDINKIGAYTCSAHTPATITTILNRSNNFFKCGVVYYGFFLTEDFKYLSQIDSMSQKMGFKTPRLPKPESWRKDLPIMIVRAGKDNVPYLNQSLESFYTEALYQNLPICLINYPNGVHAFDVINDNDTTRTIIKNTLEFWKYYLEQ